MAAEPPPPSRPAATEPASVPKLDLPREVAEWFVNEVEPGFRQDIAAEIRFQMLHYANRYRGSVLSNSVAEHIAQCRPAENLSGNDAYYFDRSGDLVNFFAKWAARWVLAGNPDLPTAHAAVGAGLWLAGEKWERMKPLNSAG